MKTISLKQASACLIEKNVNIGSGDDITWTDIQSYNGIWWHWASSN